jgi:hypothetical protein
VTDHPANPLSDAELRLLLRGLPKEREPGRDLWASIQADIQRSPGKKRSIWSSFAMAASLAFVAVLALPLISQKPSIDSNTLNAQVVSGEVNAMDAEYQAALREFSTVELAPEMQAQLRLLDDSASKLKQAIHQSPQSTYLIPMLRRTYLQRLQLTQRAITTDFT